MALVIQTPRALFSRVERYVKDVLVSKLEEEAAGEAAGAPPKLSLRCEIEPCKGDKDGVVFLTLVRGEPKEDEDDAEGKTEESGSAATAEESSWGAGTAELALRLYELALADRVLSRYFNRVYFATMATDVLPSGQPDKLVSTFVPDWQKTTDEPWRAALKRAKTGDETSSVTASAPADDQKSKKLDESAVPEPCWVSGAVDTLLAVLDKEIPAGTEAKNRVRIQAFPREAERALGNALLTRRPELVFHPVTFDSVLFVIYLSDQSRAFVSFEPGARFYVRNGNDVAAATAEKEDNVSRAHWKIREALERVRAPPQPDWTVLDVGAAPGGWTRYFAPICKSVVANDPALMDAALLEQYKNVTHVRGRLQNKLDVLRFAFVLWFVWVCVADFVFVSELGPFDAVVCDINVEPALASDTLAMAVKMLKPGGHFVFTFKLPKRKEWSDGQQTRIESLRQLYCEKCPDLENVQIVWLLANKHERTLIARRRMA
jgi:23S rRNA U2552 (ribose-2'-O)-methylase RlmE/FtsJ